MPDQEGAVYANLEARGVEILKKETVDLTATDRSASTISIVEIVIVKNKETGNLTLLGITDDQRIFANIRTTSSLLLGVFYQGSAAHISNGGKEISSDGKIIDSEDHYQVWLPLTVAVGLPSYRL